jgi:hypothetical protein
MRALEASIFVRLLAVAFSVFRRSASSFLAPRFEMVEVRRLDAVSMPFAAKAERSLDDILVPPPFEGPE